MELLITKDMYFNFNNSGDLFFLTFVSIDLKLCFDIRVVKM